MKTRRQWLQDAAALTGGAALPALGLGAAMASLPGCARRDSTRLPPDVQGGWVGAQVERGHHFRDHHAQAASAPAADPERVHTLIVGAGIAGLSAARVLMQAGLDDFALLDLEDDAGGNARGHRMQGLPCPLGAHYLPVPGPDAVEVAQWLEEIGLIRHQNGRWVGDERHLCHSPQERVFVPDPRRGANVPDQPWWLGQWHEGLIPHAAMGKEDEAQFRRFHDEVAEARKQLGFSMPTHKTPWLPGHAALDASTFTRWLDGRGFTSPALRWYVDYACRDDYGAGASRVSAWAGLQYFASRHGDGEPAGRDGEDATPVLTWPQGNAWLVDKLVAGLGSRWRGGQVVMRVDEGRHDVTVQAWSVKAQRMETWVARHVVMAVPLFIARRLLASVPSPLLAVAPRMAQAPWLVGNLLLQDGWQDRTGAPLSWDNVPYASQGAAGIAPPSLGYVDARHQSLAPATGPMLLTHYWALGGQGEAEGTALRRALLKDDWRTWAARIAADLAHIHPELPGRVLRIDLMRHGHAMSIPVPGLRGHEGLAALREPQGRLHFAHADLSAYSVFEEAFTHGVQAAHQILSAAGMQRGMA